MKGFLSKHVPPTLHNAVGGLITLGVVAVLGLIVLIVPKLFKISVVVPAWSILVLMLTAMGAFLWLWIKYRQRAKSATQAVVVEFKPLPDSEARLNRVVELVEYDLRHLIEKIENSKAQFRSSNSAVYQLFWDIQGDLEQINKKFFAIYPEFKLDGATQGTMPNAKISRIVDQLCNHYGEVMGKTSSALGSAGIEKAMRDEVTKILSPTSSLIITNQEMDGIIESAKQRPQFKAHFAHQK